MKNGYIARQRSVVGQRKRSMHMNGFGYFPSPKIARAIEF